jgi:hypothetical protein
MGFVDTHYLLREEEYYKFRSPKPKPIPGAYLIQKTPFVDFIRVTRPDGSSRSFHTKNRDLNLNLLNIGIPADKQDQVLSHVMNFQSAYIRIDHADNWGVPQSTLPSTN